MENHQVDMMRYPGGFNGEIHGGFTVMVNNGK
jgi:hypothetical protein